MEELIKAVDGHWPVWLIAIALCFMFIKDMFEIIFRFIKGRQSIDAPVSHYDIYTRLGRGDEKMDQIMEKIDDLKKSFDTHCQTDAQFATEILKRLPK